MEIYECIKPFSTNFGSWKIGDKFYKEPYESVEGTNNYYPFNGSYPLWDRNIQMGDILRKIEDTDEPKEYYINKVYSQWELDEIVNKKPPKGL